jgi:hypothetical protein
VMSVLHLGSHVQRVQGSLATENPDEMPFIMSGLALTHRWTRQECVTIIMLCLDKVPGKHRAE